ncbi:MAG: SRPBCC family protein [Rhodobacter sp.]|nr:SRPBCC family protein [Rhodobacter sp.]
MRFTTREDIEAPIENVFAAASDFDGFERQALRRGAEVTRRDNLDRIGVGSEWFLKFRFRGKEREVEARIVQFTPPNSFRVDSRIGGLHSAIDVELLALSPRRTRLQVAVDLKPQSLSARLLVQSLKFAKSNINKRFANRVWQYAQDIEGKYRNAG